MVQPHNNPIIKGSVPSTPFRLFRKYNKPLFVAVLIILANLPATAQTCENLINEAVKSFKFPNLEIKATAGIKTYGSLEADKRAYTGINLSIPIFSGAEKRKTASQRLRMKKELWRAIANIKSLTSELKLHRQIAEYRKKRIAKAIEDNEKLLKELAEIEQLKAQIRETEATLKAYGIPPQKALTCSW